jgi:hypothetical protein
MQRLIFFIIFLVAFSELIEAKDIEVIIGGKSYYSMDAYKATRGKVKQAELPKLEKIDPLTQRAYEELNYVSSEDNVSRVKSDFSQNWDNPSPKFTIDSSELVQRLEAVADDRKEPVLVVSEKGKLRVMLLNEE